MIVSPALTPERAAGMRADVSLILLATRAKRMARMSQGAESRSPESSVVKNFDGTYTRRLKSIEDVTSFLKVNRGI